MQIDKKHVAEKLIEAGLESERAHEVVEELERDFTVVTKTNLELAVARIQSSMLFYLILINLAAFLGVVWFIKFVVL